MNANLTTPRTVYTIERSSDAAVIDCDRDEVTAWTVAQCLAEANTVGEPIRLVAHTLH